MELYEFVVVYAGLACMMVVTFWFGRKLSSRIEERTEKIRELRKQFEASERELQKMNAVIDGRQREIEQLKLTLVEKDKKIAELEERTKFAEKVSERDIALILQKISDMRAKLTANLEETLRALRQAVAEEEAKKK